MINRETVPTKTDRVLKATVLPRCSPGLDPGSTTVSSRCRPMCTGFTTVTPGFTLVVYGGVAVTSRLSPGVLKKIETGMNLDTTGCPRLVTIDIGLPRFYSLNPSMYYSIAITVMEKTHIDIHPRKKRSPVLKDCLFVNMIILGCKAVDIQKVNRLFFQLGHLKV